MKYPEWKIIGWRFLRIFVSAFVVGMAGILTLIKDTAFQSWSNFFYALLIPAVSAGLAAGINAVGKYIRDKYGNKNQTSIFDKIPV